MPSQLVPRKCYFYLRKYRVVVLLRVPTPAPSGAMSIIIEEGEQVFGAVTGKMEAMVGSSCIGDHGNRSLPCPHRGFTSQGGKLHHLQLSSVLMLYLVSIILLNPKKASS